MSKQGQHNYKGINAQAWAAMSLFLQYLRDPNFSYIQLEAPKLADFILVFNDGHKIICESKNWSRKFSFSHLRKVLNSILKRSTIGENDEILIICTNLDEKLEEKVRNIKYFYKFISPKFKRKNFTDQQIIMLEKVKFWKVQEKDNHLIVYSLFGELLNFWLPEDELECKADSILIKKIYEGSAKGNIYKKEDILSEIESLKEKIVKYSGYFDDERVEAEIQLHNLIEAIDNNKSPVWAPDQLKALSSKPALTFFVLDRLKEKKIDNLQEWDELWQIHKVYRFSFSLFKIFEKNLHTEENKKYILQFFKDNISKIRKFYQHDFFDVDVVKITKKILNEDKKNEFISDAFEIIKKLITERRDDIFYLKSQLDSSWERDEIAKLLKEIYEKADFNLRDKIYQFIVQTYNLVEDDGEFSHYTPREVFEILKDWLLYDFKKRFLMLKNNLSQQYDELYKKKFRYKKGFNGWELMGGVTTFWGGEHKVSDRHFILFTLRPALENYYKNNPKKAWRFIKENCIISEKQVSKNKPDFLNRTVIPIILERYKSDNKKISEEAFEILKEFILSRKGIPPKSDLIYQEIKNNYGFSDDKIWKLAKVSIDKHGIPINVFIEEIVSSLAKKGHKEAKNVLLGWSKNPKYYKRFRFEISMIKNIRTVLDSDFDYAVNLFGNFINSEYFIDKQGHFESYDVAVLLHDILKKDFRQGLKILKSLAEKERLTENQQIILCFSLFNHRGSDESNNLELLEKVYKEFLSPLLNSFGDDINKICKKLTFRQSREAIVQFADRLARHNKVKEALRIVRIFINDPDPYLPGEDPEDPENKYNEHKKILDGEEPTAITSVRGWCAWVLMKCIILEGRDYIDDIIKLTQKLAEDENWYVRHMACFTLSRLAQVRLNVMPKDKNILFFDNDKEKALKKAKEVEKIAFKLLKEVAQATFKKFPEEAIVEAIPLFLYFAEFRQDNFKNWKWKLPGLYDDLEEFDNKPFQDILKELIEKNNAVINRAVAYQCYDLIKKYTPGVKETKNFFSIAYKYLCILGRRYDHDVFNIIYMSIKEGMEKKQHFDDWYGLYINCLKREKDFYEKNLDKEKIAKMYWWPSFYHKDILMLIYQQGSKQKFLEAFGLLVTFRKEVDIHESDEVVALLNRFSKTNKKARAIVDRLFKRNPSKYYELRKQWFGTPG